MTTINGNVLTRGIFDQYLENKVIQTPIPICAWVGIPIPFHCEHATVRGMVIEEVSKNEKFANTEKIIPSNQLFSICIKKSVVFTKFLAQKRDSRFP